MPVTSCCWDIHCTTSPEKCLFGRGRDTRHTKNGIALSLSLAGLPGRRNNASRRLDWSSGSIFSACAAQMHYLLCLCDSLIYLVLCCIGADWEKDI